MNLWLTLLAPILGLNILVRLIQYLSDLHFKDKNIIAVFTMMLQAVLNIIIAMLVNSLDFDIVVIWLIALTIPLTYLQASFDMGMFDMKISRFKSFLLTSVISTLALFVIVFFWVLL